MIASLGLTVTTRATAQCPLLADIVAKRFLASERETLIQDQPLTRNVDSQIHSHRFDCCVFQFYIPSAAAFAIISALLGPREMSNLSPQSGLKRTLIRSLSPSAI